MMIKLLHMYHIDLYNIHKHAPSITVYLLAEVRKEQLPVLLHYLLLVTVSLQKRLATHREDGAKRVRREQSKRRKEWKRES